MDFTLHFFHKHLGYKHTEAESRIKNNHISSMCQG